MPQLLKAIFIACLIFPFALAHCQSTFYAGYESATYPRGFNRIVPTPDQGFAIITGGIESSILKFDANWNIQWTYELDSVYTLEDLILTSGNKLVVMGNSNSGYNALYLAQFDLSGNIMWQEDVEYDYAGSYSLTAFSLLNAYDDGFLILGGNCVGENLVFRMDKDGAVVWSKEYPNISQSGTGAIWEGVQTGNGEYVLLSSNRDVSFYKINDSGSLLWHTHYNIGSQINSQIKEIVASPTAGFYASGKFYDANNVQHQFLAAISSQGTISWAKQLSESGNTSMSSISEMLISPSNEIMLFGTLVKSNNQNTQYQVSRFDLQGNHLSTNISGSDFFQYGFDEIRDMVYVGNDLYMCGHSAYDNDVVAKLNADGTGFCNSAAFTPVITDITPSTVFMADNANTFNLPIKTIPKTYVHPIPNYAQTLFCGSIPLDAEGGEAGEWMVWPQPAQEDFWLKHPAAGEGSVRIVDLAGREVAKQQVEPGTGQTRIFAGAIPVGAYLLEAEVGGQRHSQKLILK